MLIFSDIELWFIILIDVFVEAELLFEGVDLSNFFEFFLIIHIDLIIDRLNFFNWVHSNYINLIIQDLRLFDWFGIRQLLINRTVSFYFPILFVLIGGDILHKPFIQYDWLNFFSILPLVLRLYGLIRPLDYMQLVSILIDNGLLERVVFFLQLNIDLFVDLVNLVLLLRLWTLFIA